MANVTFKGNLSVSDSDYHELVFTGRTKSGAAVSITLHNAINMDDISLSLKEKDDTVAEATWTACYDNTDDMERLTVEPWEITCADSTVAGASSIVTGAGVLSIDGTDVALCKGGSEFTVARTFREQSADGDMGPVKGRIELDDARATLKVSLLTFIASMDKVYTGITKTTGEA